MTRLTKYRFGWIVVAILLTIAAFVVLRWLDFQPLAILVVALVLVIPGRLQGILWRDFFRGSRLLRIGRPREAIPYFERFRTRLQERPGLSRAMWLQWPGYTPNALAMTLNNLGAAQLHAGELNEAVSTLRATLAVDAEMSIAWYNLALTYDRLVDSESCANSLAEARRLGFKGNIVDSVQRAGGALLTSIEGRGNAV